MLEVGSWLGNGSTQTFIKNLNGGTLFCVDTWMGNANVARHQAIVSEFDVYKTFLKNIQSHPSVQPIRAKSLDAVQTFDDGSLDLVFIDGDHSFAAVRADIAAWLPKVRPGGILCGHDCEIHMTRKNYQSIIENRAVDTIESPDRRFACIHPGSILAVHEKLGNRANLCSDEIITLPVGAGYSSIWYAHV